MKDDALFMNKIAAAVITAGLIAMTAGFLASFIYNPVTTLEQNSYIIEVPESGTAVAAVVEEPTGPESISAMLASADVAAGEKLSSRRCASCHSFDDGGPNKTGPGLWNIVNADKGGHDGYKYSDALAAMEGDWSYENLNGFLYNPKQYVAGTKMAFKGLRKDEDRANLIAYLRTLSPSPAPLP